MVIYDPRNGESVLKNFDRLGPTTTHEVRGWMRQMKHSSVIFKLQNAEARNSQYRRGLWLNKKFKRFVCSGATHNDDGSATTIVFGRNELHHSKL